MNAQLHDKTFLITGASGGIGQATARLFASEDAVVIAHYRNNEVSINQLGVELGEKCFPVQAELSDETQVDEMYRLALLRFPRIDGIVVNAGVWSEPEQGLHEISLERWQNSLDANLT
ncbi:MAG: SDR family oxidoreductase, partial [Planctomycetes bacterium]|nr:SDR family oxidoreductase [Planctomycetota bacterium]